ncbi:MAG: hypothetical protein JWN52_1645 [Actinomycetia bacterium]|nr:hypothetical protein [Actinomycetes bacterium]
MRHTFGLILGVILTPALAYGAGWGYTRAGASYDAINQSITDRTQLYGAFALMAAVGLVTGIVILARWASPFVSLVPALAFIGWTVCFLVVPKSALEVPDKLPPAGELDTALRVLLGYGVFGLMGFALLVPTWAPRRWGRGDDGDERSGSRSRSQAYDSY